MKRNSDSKFQTKQDKKKSTVPFITRHSRWDEVFTHGFARGDTAGSGIGLYLVKQIITTYEGQIDIGHSELGGTRFTLTLQKGKPY